MSVMFTNLLTFCLVHLIFFVFLVASDAHGNYLIQYILQHGTLAQQDEVANQIKKHMVSLRGSKWGSKCAWLIDRNRTSNSVNAVGNASLRNYRK